jgi:hypothetical protein
MSRLYRPTPVFNPGPPRGIPLSGAVSGGAMRGYDSSVNWKAFFDSKRAALQGSPWIVLSGTMGSFVSHGLGQDDGSDGSDLPLSPIDDSNLNLSPLISPLPVDVYPMPAPIAAAIAPYNPGPVASAPSIVSSGGSLSSPAASPTSTNAASSMSSLISSIAAAGTSIVKAATGQTQINPTIPPPMPAVSGTSSALVAQAQSLQAQAAALAASNPTLAAQYTAEANALLAQSGTSSSWLTQSTILPGVPDVAVYGIGIVALIGIAVAMKGGK